MEHPAFSAFPDFAKFKIDDKKTRQKPPHIAKARNLRMPAGCLGAWPDQVGYVAQLQGWEDRMLVGLRRNVAAMVVGGVFVILAGMCGEALADVGPVMAGQSHYRVTTPDVALLAKEASGPQYPSAADTGFTTLAGLAGIAVARRIVQRR